MRRDEAYLLDILIATRKALRFVEGVDWPAFQQNEMLQYAVVRPLEIVGEAARGVSKEMRESHPEVPWEKLIGMRNRLVHEYFRVDVETVWRTIQDDLPQLVRCIEPLVPPEVVPS